jgi:hypothetical protein
MMEMNEMHLKLACFQKFHEEHLNLFLGGNNDTNNRSRRDAISFASFLLLFKIGN